MEYLHNESSSFIYLGKDKFVFHLPYSFLSIKLVGFPTCKGVDYIPKNPFWQYSIIGKIQDGTFRHGKHETFDVKSRVGYAPLYRVREKNQKRLSLYIEDIEPITAYALVKRKWNVKDLLEGMFYYKGVITEEHIEFAREVDLYMLRIILKNSKSYEETEIPKVWMDDYLASIRSGRVLLDKTGTFPAKRTTGYDSYYDTLGFGSINVHWSTVQRFINEKKVLYYGTKADEDLVRRLHSYFSLSRKIENQIHDVSISSSYVSLIIVSRENERILSNLKSKHIIHVKDAVESKFFKTLLNKVGAAIICKELFSFINNAGTLLGEESRAMKQLGEIISKLYEYSKGFAAPEDPELYATAKSYINFHNSQFLQLNNERIPIEGVTKMLRAMEEKTPWVFTVKALEGRERNYDSLIKFIQKQIKSPLLYE